MAPTSGGPCHRQAGPPAATGACALVRGQQGAISRAHRVGGVSRCANVRALLAHADQQWGLPILLLMRTSLRGAKLAVNVDGRSPAVVGADHGVPRALRDGKR
eukprot:5484441-Prymnesium_polylepis.3